VNFRAEICSRIEAADDDSPEATTMLGAGDCER
jgi:hypothetical protein